MMAPVSPSAAQETETGPQDYFEGPDEVEPNNTWQQANGPLRAWRDYHGYPDDKKDYFSIEVYKPGEITIDLTGHTGEDVQLQLFYESTSNRVASATAPPYHLEHTGNPGTYYIYINTGRGWNTDTKYTLRAGFPMIQKVHLPIVRKDPPNRPPNSPSAPTPADGATDQRVDVKLSWSGGDPDGNSVTYDVYLEGNDSTPDLLVSEDQTETAYTPGKLVPNSRYYWRVVAIDESGATASGPVWSFMTGIFADSGQSLGDADSRDVSAGDLDGDGDFDAVVVNLGAANEVWLNSGSGSFVTGRTFGGFSSQAADLGDLDDDGDLDVFLATGETDYGQPNEVWLNDGAGNFVDSAQRLGNSDSWDIALGDLDGDGDLDAFVANRSVGDFGLSNANKVWLNDGSGRFNDSGQNIGDSHSYSIALGNLDGDSDLDAVVGNGHGLLNRVWLNDGHGVFSAGQRLNISSTNVTLGNLDKDGDIDAIIESQVWYNDGIGNLSNSNQGFDTPGFFVNCVTVGDIDLDGDLDALVTLGAGMFCLEGTNQVWVNDGEGIFQDVGQTLGNSCGGAGVLVDVDGDYDLDAFIANIYPRANTVWLNQYWVFGMGLATN
jgi:hypothetical protein